MASSESSHSNAVMDISHVLESLGSLIGELDAIEIDKVNNFLHGKLHTLITYLLIKVNLWQVFLKSVV